MLAPQLGVSRGAIASLRATRQERVLASTAAAVAALYDDCWWRTPPNRSRDLIRTETWAIRQGWLDPSRWLGLNLDDPATQPTPIRDELDLVAVNEAIAGRPVHLTRAEQHQAVAALLRRGVPVEQSARAIGRSARTVVRYRRAMCSATA